MDYLENYDEGGTVEEIAKKFAKKVAAKTTDAEVIKIEKWDNYVSVLVRTNTDFEAWIDYDYYSECGEWLAYIFDNTNLKDILQRHLQANDEIFELMEGVGFNYLLKNGIIKEEN